MLQLAGDVGGGEVALVGQRQLGEDTRVQALSRQAGEATAPWAQSLRRAHLAVHQHQHFATAVEAAFVKSALANMRLMLLSARPSSSATAA